MSRRWCFFPTASQARCFFLATGINSYGSYYPYDLNVAVSEAIARSGDFVGAQFIEPTAGWSVEYAVLIAATEPKRVSWIETTKTGSALPGYVSLRSDAQQTDTANIRLVVAGTSYFRTAARFAMPDPALPVRIETPSGGIVYAVAVVVPHDIRTLD